MASPRRARPGSDFGRATLDACDTHGNAPRSGVTVKIA
jgi:hypothetical protein